MLRDTASKQCLDLQGVAHLLNVNRLVFLVEGYAVRNYTDVRHLGQAVVNAFRDSI